MRKISPTKESPASASRDEETVSLRKRRAVSEGEVLTETEGARSTDPVHQSKERRADC